MVNVFKSALKSCLSGFGIGPFQIQHFIRKLTLKMAIKEQGLWHRLDEFRKIAPNLDSQESLEMENCDLNFFELKRRGLQVFQIDFIFEILRSQNKSKSPVVVDIGDSAGTHMQYVKEMGKEFGEVETISVNLDPRAIKKIKDKGMNAILSRAEELDLGDKKVDLFTSFEMVEHLHDPSRFFYNLSTRGKSEYLLVTVPYLRSSRVGLHHVRREKLKDIYAEEEHVFELSPEDWKLIMKHSGWKIIKEKVYYQYPVNLPLISRLLSVFWKRIDYEGFWAVWLKKDNTYSKRYLDWG